jgi:hypothetical protein
VPGTPRQSSLSARDLEALRLALEDGEDASLPRTTKDDYGQLERERALRRAAERRAEQAEASERALRAVLGQLQHRIGELMAGTASSGAAALPATVRAPGEDLPAPQKDGRVRTKGVERGAAVERAPARDGKGRPTATDAPPSGVGLDKCQRAILSALVQHGGPMPQARLARITGYPVRSSSIKNGLSKLRPRSGSKVVGPR